MSARQLPGCRFLTDSYERSQESLSLEISRCPFRRNNNIQDLPRDYRGALINTQNFVIETSLSLLLIKQ
ncbi:hypothetical protein NQ317_000264 [Molorchus minor]|uniref:Uncharacterized protein n=1 Tax=Molorchus minor TaxID=1323400 RepID=A0ABQ9IW51_9CUCU|nr:hypothetical protein NQ317_000264 [Molorchus minor]